MGTHDGSLQFWNVAARRRIASLRAHKSIITGLDFAPDHRTLVTASVEQSVHFWSAPTFIDIDGSNSVAETNKVQGRR